MNLYRYDEGDDPTVDLTPFQTADTVEIDVEAMFADDSYAPHVAGCRCMLCERQEQE